MIRVWIKQMWAQANKTQRNEGGSVMESKKSLAPNRKVLPETKPHTSSDSAMLNPSEAEQVRQKDSEASAYARKVFSRRQS